jgi:hypothetical protein
MPFLTTTVRTSAFGQAGQVSGPGSGPLYPGIRQLDQAGGNLVSERLSWYLAMESVVSHTRRKNKGRAEVGGAPWGGTTSSGQRPS